MAVELREADIGDIPDLCKLTYAQHKEEGLEAHGHSFSMATSFKCYEDCLRSPDWIVYVAEDNEELVAYIVHGLRQPPYDKTMIIGHEQGWYTKPSHRGQGIGYKLLYKAEEHWIKLGIRNFSLGSVYGNEALVESYKKRGYQPAEVLFYKHVEVPPKE